jgi:hypothetical protein
MWYHIANIDGLSVRMSFFYSPGSFSGTAQLAIHCQCSARRPPGARKTKWCFLPHAANFANSGWPAIPPCKRRHGRAWSGCYSWPIWGSWAFWRACGAAHPLDRRLSADLFEAIEEQRQASRQLRQAQAEHKSAQAWLKAVRHKCEEFKERLSHVQTRLNALAAREERRKGVRVRGHRPD